MAAPVRWLPESWVWNSMYDESVVNGVWAEILRSYFPLNAGNPLINNHYLVYPEHWVSNKFRADLVVMDMDRANNGNVANLRTVFAFEGKGVGASWDLTKSQLLGYVKNLNRSWQSKKFGMVGIGNQCAFFYYNGANLVNLVVIIANGNITGVNDNWNVGNITFYELGFNNACIDYMLEFIAGKLVIV